MRVDDFERFVMARHDIYLARQAGRPKPWTDDPILQRYRFCNVYRELDTVTEWIREYWREPMAVQERRYISFWMLVARLVNWPDTLSQLTDMALRNKWNEKLFMNTITNIQISGSKAWGGAYIVSTNGNAMQKAEYIATQVLTPAWQTRKEWRPRAGSTLQDLCENLMKLNGVQGFIAGQVIADAKYADPVLCAARDWHTFAISGPGSRRGMNRVMGRELNARIPERQWLGELIKLRNALSLELKRFGTGYSLPHAQDVQNCLCEFDKYERVRLGQGRPRATYPGV